MIIELLVCVIALYVMYRLLVSYKPKIHVNLDGNVAPIISQMKTLKENYKPTPWLVNRHIHTMWGMRFRKTTNNYRREIYTFEDQGQCALDWFETENMPEDAPILVIIHTLAGGTREPCSNNLANHAKKIGIRAVVFNNRGCSGVKFTSPRFYHALKTDDTTAIINHIKTEFKPKYIFLVGFSLGGYQAVQYDTVGEHIDAVGAISHTYNGNGANDCLSKPIERRLYLPFMMSKLTHLLSKNKFVNYPKALHAKTLDEYDDEYTCKYYDIPSHVEYYDSLSIYHKIPEMRRPTLVIGSDDDPFTLEKYQPIKQVTESMNCAFVHVPEGGHVSFNTGLDGQASYAENVMLDFFQTFMRLKDQQNS